jgi:hypothetical protein
MFFQIYQTVQHHIPEDSFRNIVLSVKDEFNFQMLHRQFLHFKVEQVNYNELEGL